MGRLYDAIQSVESIIQAKGLNPSETRGMIGMKAGFFLVIIRPDTEDDPEKLASLKRAAEDVLGVRVPF